MIAFEIDLNFIEVKKVKQTIDFYKRSFIKISKRTESDQLECYEL